MWKKCRRCRTANARGFDSLERLLQHGLPPMPNSRATKNELRAEIERLRGLLDDVRGALIRVYLAEARSMIGSNPEIRKL